MTIDTARWTLVGDTTNTRHFEIEPGILAVFPHAGACDDLATATENARFQTAYLRALGRPGALVVFIDGMASQDRDARRVYQQELLPSLCCAGALVASTLLARAIASFFFGLSRPKVPIQMFAEADAALLWVREMMADGPQGPLEPRGTPR